MVLKPCGAVRFAKTGTQKHKQPAVVRKRNYLNMEQQFEAVLTGTDTPVTGIVTERNGVYEFNSLDESLQLVIIKDEDGKWIRVSGTDPYLTGWVDELAEQIPGVINN